MNEFVDADRTIRDTLALAARRLAEKSDSPRLDADLLLARALDVSRSYLVAHPDDHPDPAALLRFSRSVDERARGVPIAYIVGEKEFWSLSLIVSSDTLIPRPDTELLVEQALHLIPGETPCRVLDLGTGSGAVALSIAHERPQATVVATDVSDAALTVARENARQLDIANVEFDCGDWTQPVSGQLFDVVVSNPPYVRANDPALDTLQHEPQNALVAGNDGLDAIRALAASCADILVASGAMLLEHGADQQPAVEDILRRHGWQDIECFRDLGGKPRVTRALRPN